MNTQATFARRTCIAPMLDWTDRHYRYMARQITRHTWLYTEMIHAGAVIHGQPDRFLAKHESEHPIALQLGGSDPMQLAQAAAKVAQYGYDEINLNCGCPSPRVQKGAFGACLMNDVALVAHCLNAMQDAAPHCEITIKHRIGLDKQTAYQPLEDFVGELVRQTSCRVFIVHARNAWLAGLSPKENRDVPPLRYDYVYQLKQAFPELSIIINGGIKTNQEIQQHLQYVDGVMVGREAYHHPMLMRSWDTLFYGDTQPEITHEQLIHQLYQYAHEQIASGRGTTLKHMARHYLGIMHGLQGAKVWRRMLSDAAVLQHGGAERLLQAWASAQHGAE